LKKQQPLSYSRNTPPFMVHYRVYKRTPLAPTLIQTNLVHNFPRYFPKINPTVTFPLTSRSSEWSLPFRFADVKLHPFYACYMPRSFHTLDLITLMISDEVYKS